MKCIFEVVVSHLFHYLSRRYFPIYNSLFRAAQEIWGEGDQSCRVISGNKVFQGRLNIFFLNYYSIAFQNLKYKLELIAQNRSRTIKFDLEASNSTRRGGEGETYVIPTWCLLAKELNVVKFKGTARNQGTCNFFVWKQKKEKEEENDVLPF
jgi:hypothetical protein